MDDAQDAASDAGRLLARARWGNTKVRRAAEVLLERAEVLDPALRTQLEQIAEAPDE